MLRYFGADIEGIGIVVCIRVFHQAEVKPTLGRDSY